MGRIYVNPMYYLKSQKNLIKIGKTWKKCQNYKDFQYMADKGDLCINYFSLNSFLGYVNFTYSR